MGNRRSADDFPKSPRELFDEKGLNWKSPTEAQERRFSEQVSRWYARQERKTRRKNQQGQSRKNQQGQSGCAVVGFLLIGGLVLLSI